MRVRTLPLVVLVAAAAALVVSIGWAVARADDGGWMMSRNGPGMMGMSAGGGSGEPVRDLAAARRQAQRFADRLDLETGEVMRFSSNYYAELVERSGRPATEVLVDPTTGSVWLEYGPAMMWNTRYGMMADFRLKGSSGMMGRDMMGGGTMNGAGMMNGNGMMGGAEMMGGTDSPSAQTRTRNLSADEARAIAQRWLDRNADNLAAEDAVQFPGYYTLHAVRDGKVAGMLSVNAATGAVWSHWWHGRYVSMSA